MAQGNGATIRVYLWCIVSDTQLTQHRQALTGKCFVKLDHVEIAYRNPQTLGQLAHRRHRANAHDTWSNAAAGHAQNAGTRGQAVFLHRCGRGQDHRRSTVVHARGVAGGDRLVRAVDRFELGQRLQRGFRAQVFVTFDDDFALLVSDTHRHNFFGKEAGSLCSGSLLLAAQGESVLSARET